MKHFHGTPVGGSRQDAARFLLTRHALVPFPRQDDLAVVAETCQSFVFDNGAFSVWKRGLGLDIADYTAWVRDWCRHPGFEWALIPDVIDGDEKANDVLIARFQDAGLGNFGVPVWHLHESFERFARLCNDWPTVAMGSSAQWSSPGTRAWWQRVGQAMDAVCDAHGRPPARLHGLRMMDPDIFTRLPLTSADSTNAAVNNGSLSRFGMYPAPTSAQRAAVIAERIEVHNSAAVWVRQPQQVALDL